MILYLLIVGIAATVIAGVNIIFLPEAFSYYNIWIIVVLLLCIVAEIALTATFSFLAELLPEKWFYPKRKFFTISKKERAFYEIIGIKRWKNAVCELGMLVGHNKRKFEKPNDPRYIEMFILEGNRAMVGHLLDALASFLVILLLPMKYCLRLTLPVALVAAFLNILPAIVIRYNLPKLQVILKRARRNEQNLALNIIN